MKIQSASPNRCELVLPDDMEMFVDVCSRNANQNDEPGRAWRLRVVNGDLIHGLRRRVIQFQPVRPAAIAACPASRSLGW